jgi:hypothetical protein
MVAKRRKKKPTREERSVQILADKIVVRDERLVIVVRRSSRNWHTGEDFRRTGMPVGSGKALFAHPQGGITIGNKLPGPKR